MIVSWWIPGAVVAAEHLYTALGPADENPWSIFEGSSTQMLVLLAIIPVAVLVFWFGSRQFRQQRGSLRPQGRTFREGGVGSRDQKWRNTVERLERRPPTPIAEATAGAVHIRGRIIDASGNLGGPPGRECVWRNRAGARRESAVGAELLIVADDTGHCGIEGIESASIVTPTESHTVHYETVSLYIGDVVDAFGVFEPEPRTEDVSADPSQLVYGTLGPGRLDVRLVERPSATTSSPEAEPEDEPEDEAEAEPEADDAQTASEAHHDSEKRT